MSLTSEPISYECRQLRASVPSRRWPERRSKSEAVKHHEEFPQHQVVREIGLHRMVSIVPRSFSPTVRSMAGYMAPVRESRMTK